MMEDTCEAPFVWNDRSNPYILQGKLADLYSKQFACDVTLLVGEKEFPAHKIILAASSPYFERMFTSDFIEATQSKIRLNDIESDIMNSIIQYCYSSVIVIPQEKLMSAISAAEMLQMSSMKCACCKALIGSINSENCLSIFKFSLVYCGDSVKMASAKFIRDNFQYFALEDELLDLEINQLKILLNCDQLEIYSEIDVFNFIVKWYRHNLAERNGLFPELFKLVHIEDLPAKVLLDCIELSEFVNEDLSCRYHISSVKSKQLLKSNGKLSQNQCPRSMCLGKTIYVMGGVLLGGVKASNTVVHCDIEEKLWKESPVMLQGRDHFGACLYQDTIYACGGSIETGMSTASLEGYHLNQQLWKTYKPMKKARKGLGLCESEGWIYAAGGFTEQNSFPFSSVECYDPIRDTWHDIACLNERRAHFSLSASQGAFYAIGGKTCENEINTPVKAIERYDPRVGYWSCITNLETAHSTLSKSFLSDEVIIVIGCDRSSSNLFDGVICYFDIRAGKWVNLATTCSPLIHFAVAKAGNHGYITGGVHLQNRIVQDSVLSFDRYTFESTVTHSSLPIARNNHCMVVV